MDASATIAELPQLQAAIGGARHGGTRRGSAERNRFDPAEPGILPRTPSHLLTIVAGASIGAALTVEPMPAPFPTTASQLPGLRRIAWMPSEPADDFLATL